jgi:hypothetical protein
MRLQRMPFIERREADQGAPVPVGVSSAGSDSGVIVDPRIWAFPITAVPSRDYEGATRYGSQSEQDHRLSQWTRFWSVTTSVR